MSRPTPLSEDAINRYRIIHPEKEMRPLSRRLHRYGATTALGTEPEGMDHERDMIRLEAMKWKMGVERMLGSVRNLERQRTTYQARATETVEKTDTLKQTLEEEKVLLETRRRERDRMIKCDEVAAKITARGKTRQELDERIAVLQQSLEEHKAALKVYQETAQGRVDIFNQIADLVKNCRELKLPIDPNATVPVEDEVEKPDLDEKEKEKAASTSSGTTAANSNATKLSSMALPFQPSGGTSSSAPGTSRAKSKSRGPTPPTSAALPARPPSGPSRLPSAPPRGPGSSSLPARPSSLRSSTTGPMNASGSSLEEGELGGDEDGEVRERDRGTKRALEPERSSGRSTRSRK